MAAKHKKNVKFRVSVIDNEGKEVFLSDKRPDTSEEPVYKRIRISFITTTRSMTASSSSRRAIRGSHCTT